MKFIPNVASAKLARAALHTRKHSPIIMFSTGLAGTVVATVLACRSTLKLEEVLGKAEDTRLKIKRTVADKPDEVYSEKDAESDLRLLRIKTAGNVAKLYAPAIAVGLVSAGLLTSAHVVLTKRNAALGAAYIAVDKAFKEYRARVRNELGDERDLEFRYGSVEKEIVEEGEHGHEVKTVKRINPETGTSMYARCFDQNNKNWRSVPGANRLFLQCQQNWANDRLHARGHVLLNDVYDMLGMERTTPGAVVGWVKGNGDDYVDFGLDDSRQQVVDFFNGDLGSVWLDFNVDGPVYQLLDKINQK